MSHFYSHSIMTLFPGARDSTSTRCALGTSSRALRMLTESGDVIRYVFLRSAGLCDSVLVDGGGCGPVFLCRGILRFGVC